VIGYFAKLFRIHAKFSGHLDMGVGKMVSFADIDPGLVFFLQFGLLCHMVIYPFGAQI
jgi:hypothetical protein